MQFRQSLQFSLGSRAPKRERVKCKNLEPFIFESRLQSINYSQVTRLKPRSIETDPSSPVERCLACEADAVGTLQKCLALVLRSLGERGLALRSPAQPDEGGCEADRSELRILRYLIKTKLRHRLGFRQLGRRILNQRFNRCSRPPNIFPATMPKHGKELLPNCSREITQCR